MKIAAAGELTDVFAIQDEIARGIVNSLRLKLGSGRRRYDTSAEAYDLYLRARALQIRLGLSGYDRSIGLLEQAIAKDPSLRPLMRVSPRLTRLDRVISVSIYPAS